MDKYRKVYNMLEDQESKDIYINRLNYLITGKYKYIEYIAKKYLPELVKDNKDIYEDIKAKFPNKKIILWGMGQFFTECQEYWREKSEVICFCDKKEDKQGTSYRGKQVISPEELYKNYSDAIVVITTNSFQDEIREELLEHGILTEQIYNMKAYMKNLVSSKQYFDESFLNLSGGGIEQYFVDAGAYDLNTSIELRKRIKEKLKKSYAFEADVTNALSCEKRIKDEGLDYIEVIPKGCWSGNEELKFRATSTAGSGLCDDGESVVSVVSIDSIVNTPITFIKMDIEGAELEALKGARETIVKYKPMLAICIYHKPEDMSEIPLYIKSLVPEYKLYVRHYSVYNGETVLYAII